MLSFFAGSYEFSFSIRIDLFTWILKISFYLVSSNTSAA